MIFETTPNKLTSGNIALQFKQGSIQYQNIKIIDLDSNKEKIKGVWQLTNFDMVDENNKKTPWCEQSFGTITYSHDYVNVAINCKSNPEQIVFYSGPYSVKDGLVFHKMKNRNNYLQIQTLKREVIIDNDTLELIGPFGDSGKVIVTWKRIR